MPLDLYNIIMRGTASCYDGHQRARQIRDLKDVFLGAAASPAHLPAPPSTNGDVIMLTEEAATITAALVPDQGATPVNAPAPEGVDPVPGQTAAAEQAAVPHPSSVPHQALVVGRPAEGPPLPAAAVEDMWVGINPDVRLEPLSVTEAADEGVSSMVLFDFGL